MAKTTGVCGIVLAAVLLAQPLGAHCEIPCGIYNDGLRADLIAEHIGTIEKSINQIAELSKAGEKNYNQIVRWVQNKEAHASEIQHIVTQYFLTQRVKPADPKDRAAHEKYVGQLKALHGMLVAAMKAKQTTDLAHTARLRELLAEFRGLYFAHEAAARHVPEHRHAAGGSH